MDGGGPPTRKEAHMHWHAYTWTTTGAAEDAYRFGPPGRAAAPPPAGIRHADTFPDVGTAVDWIERRLRQVSPQLLRPIGPIDILDRANTVYDVLPRGFDVRWDARLRTGRSSHISVTCCPNRNVTHRCPLPR
jgi:hypothetical protein